MYHYREDRAGPPGNGRINERERSPLRPLAETTNDHKTVNARIFVGSIVNPVTREQLQRHFSKWGNVLGVSVTKHNFGFVQFECPEEAKACLGSGIFTMMDGMRLDVKPAKMGGGSNPSGGGMGRGAPNPGGRGGMTPYGGRGGYGGREAQNSPRRDDYFDSFYRGNGGASRSEPQEPSRSFGGEYYRDYYNREREQDRDREGNGFSQNSYTTDSRRTLDDPYSAETSHPSEPQDPARTNDVEIVVPNKLQRSYAENIETQLRRMDLLVDLLFPPPRITPQQVLNDLSARKCLYAIFITPENEKHNSLTVNILHGETQEHRNMPVEEAMRLIQHNFDAYVKKSSARNARQVVPRDIRNLLLDLLEMRTLSMGDLGKTIQYLKQRQNALVDDQIEQKRETAGNHASTIARSVAVSYPGYNYLATSMPGAPTAHGAVAAQGSVIATGTVSAAAVAGPVGLVQAAPASGAAYAYGQVPGMAPQPVVSAYGIAPPMGGQAILSNPEPQAQNKQTELQKRILNLMKNQANLGPSPPQTTGVAAPSGVPAPRMMPTTSWGSANKHNEAAIKPQTNQSVYNPWSQ